jgi:hypothetical protein
MVVAERGFGRMVLFEGVVFWLEIMMDVEGSTSSIFEGTKVQSGSYQITWWPLDVCWRLSPVMKKSWGL